MGRSLADAAEGRRPDGFTLLEIVFVVAALAILASIALVDASDSHADRRVELEGDRIVAALRYARSEAMRTGAWHSVTVDKDTGGVHVAEPILSGSTVIGEVIELHPIDKKEYSFTVGETAAAPGTTITNAAHPFTFTAVPAAVKFVYFDAQGRAMLPAGGTTYFLDEGTVVLKNGRRGRTVGLAMNGRAAVE